MYNCFIIGKEATKIRALFEVDAPAGPQNAYRTRPGSYSDGHACHRVTAVPRHLTFITRSVYFRDSGFDRKTNISV